MSPGRESREGKCHVCGLHGPLSWEHVPPKSAFNDRPTVYAERQVLIQPRLWDGTGRKVQKGSGGYTLCRTCNNITGKWYGAEYASWAQQGLELLSRIPPDERDAFFVPFRGYPLRFLKQVITMFFSVNGPEFAARHQELVRFVLSRDNRGLPVDYRVDLVLVRGPYARSSGVTGSRNIATGSLTIYSEIAHCPFALRLILDAEAPTRRGAIERFAQLGYRDFREVWLYTEAGDVVTKFPGDYRNRDQILRDAGESS